jgi:D-alanyl-lipoteichoic acid acyltransferase DltB (MBOAT superfamily)
MLGALGILFYAMWRWQFAGLLILSPTVDYLCSLRIGAASRPSQRKFWLCAALAINLGLLVFFKYTYFLYDNVRWVMSILGEDIPSLQSIGVNIVLPLGISFYKFHSISYTIDVYRRTIKPISRYSTFLTFVVLWPALIAGPILRAKEIVPQLEGRRRLSFADIGNGCLLITIGLFKKVVVADSIATMVDTAFTRDVHLMTALDVWVAAFLFGFQIYCDFSGYSDIAIGSAALLGLKFPLNFDWPYMATSPTEFWKRWHISLSFWIRDYVYMPLMAKVIRLFSSRNSRDVAGRRARQVQLMVWLITIVVTWFVMGLWHGAAWLFALWGLYHAILLICYRVIPELGELSKRWPVAAWLLMLCLVMLGWIPFRARSLSQAGDMFLKVLNPFQYTFSNHLLDVYQYAAVLILLCGMIGVHFVQLEGKPNKTAHYFEGPIVGGAVAVMVIMIIMLMHRVTQFVYFQF